MKQKLLIVNLKILVQILSISLLALFVRGFSWNDLYVIQMAGDGLTNYATAKGFVDGLNGVVNPYLGAPNGLSIFAFPSLDQIYLAMLWIISLVTQNGIFAVNFIFYLGFGLAFASSYWVLRKRSCPETLNYILSISFAFIPEHWWRQGHMALSMYWTIPLSIYYCILLGNNFFEEKFQRNMALKNRLIKIIQILLILTFLTLQGSYYSLFTIFFSAISLSLNIMSSKKFLKISTYIFLGQVLFFTATSTFFAKLAISQGTNLSIFQRATGESILYGGHLPFIFFPWPGSGIPGTSRIQAVLENAYPGSNEFKIWSAALISLISIGVLCSAIFQTSSSRKLLKKKTFEIQISKMFLVGLFLYISGGLGFLIAIFEPQLRAWNRINFFLAFLAILWLVEQIPNLISLGKSRSVISKNIHVFLPMTYFLLIALVLVNKYG